MRRDWISAFAAILCAASVALAAYASHAALPGQSSRLGLAAAFAFGHGLALILIAGRRSRIAGISRLLLLLGVAGFSGGLCYAAFMESRAATAPLGGSLLILGWLVLAFDLWRSPRG
ncbi:MAG: hypothetical protein A3E01_12690 [Gammaproteobacteria bacterium RIFCSPHIGHO2_12_FULL_63_22]|nr:MAG: hypothetical protein A3E01_12690 [Gammaproteobacteria bacterium RIFCSPHIGHO2_12_FULL_63_22]